MDSKRAACVAVVVLCSVLTAPGCGGSDDQSGGTSGTETTAEPAPTKKGYIAAADSICKKGSTGRTRELFDQSVSLDTQAQASTDGTEIAKLERKLSELTDERADLKDKVTEDLQALDEPESGAADTYLKARDRSVKISHTLADAIDEYAKKLDEQSVDTLTKAVAEGTKIGETETKEAEKFGFKECGQPLK